MKKVIVFGAIVVACAVPILSAEQFGSKSVADTTYNSVSNIIYNNTDAEDQGDVVAKGSDIVVYENEVKLQSQLSQYSDDPKTEEEALQDIIEEKALYQKAEELGYKVDDSKLDEMVENIKEMYADPKTSNREVLEAILSKYENEEEYWAYLKDRYRITETIAAYEADLMKDYAKEEGIKKEVSPDDEKWQDYREEEVNKIQEDANVKIIEEK